MSGGLPGLEAGWMGQSFTYFDTLDSTSTYLKDNADRFPNGAVIVAGSQTSGKGRLNRSWHDSGSSCLMMSVLLHDLEIEKLSCLPLVAGIAVRGALESVAGRGFKLKWSNDVIYGDKKLCGILCESRISGGKAFVIVGIGVNVTQNRAEFERLGLVYATSLELATGKKVENLRLAAVICNEFERVYVKYKENGFPALIDEYTDNCVTVGKEVRITQDNRERTGMAVGVADDGSLLCEIEGRLTSVNAGEASVRGLYGYI